MDWKSKINSVVLIFFCLLVTASALTLGQIITQEQLNNTDIQATSLEPEIIRKEKTSSQVRVWFSYFSLDENTEAGTYEVIRKNNVAVYPLENYNQCRQTENSRADCIAQGKAEIISQAKTLIRGEKASLEELQGTDYSNEINIEDFDITDNDLN